MGRWDQDSRNCSKCGNIHDCKFYEELKKSFEFQLEKFEFLQQKMEIMVNWFDSTIKNIDEENDKGFPSELNDK
jgi:hypothetical protein